MPEPPACTSTVSPVSSLALSNSMCCTVEKAIGAHAASRALMPFGAGMTSRSGMFINSVIPEEAAEFLRKVNVETAVGVG